MVELSSSFNTPSMVTDISGMAGNGVTSWVGMLLLSSLVHVDCHSYCLLGISATFQFGFNVESSIFLQRSNPTSILLHRIDECSERLLLRLLFLSRVIFTNNVVHKIPISLVSGLLQSAFCFLIVADVL